MAGTMNPEMCLVLKNINYVERYELLSKNAWIDSDDFPIDALSSEDIMQIIIQLGYSVSYNKKEQFYKIGLIEQELGYKIQLNVAINTNTVEFIWAVYYNGDLRLGTPWGRCAKLLTNNEKKIAPPRYSDKDNLMRILSKALKLYDDFVAEIIGLEPELRTSRSSSISVENDTV
ncbi:MAG: hypothetical protein LBH09_07995 [Peptococcaceae bacterium]|jgi:hypothetical protein|nr:hypothetical protein [Peptococcaceae bacterium]